jgi:hypothetical protein
MKIFILIITLLITSCSSSVAPKHKSKKPFWFSPDFARLQQGGSAEMQAGLIHGCETAHSSRGNSFSRTFSGFKQDPNLVEDSEYFDSWYRGYIYCFHIVNAVGFSPIDGNMVIAHSSFWNDGANLNPALTWPWDQGTKLPGQGEKIKMLGEGEVWWNGMFQGCKGILQC